MSYHIYTTRGIVLSQKPFREADRVYRILTRSFGLVEATAQGVRKEVSKLRGSLEPYVLSQISLVRGKEYWRITSAESICRILPEAHIARPLALLEKFVQGEVSHPELFDTIEASITALDNKDIMFEPLLVSKILFHLGYLSESDLGLEERSMVKAINEGIHASNLG